MEGPEEEEGGPAPPIATTPPHPSTKEEPLSQSSSGTQLSSVSGLSLGELIRLRSVINREMDTWCQPYIEADTSNRTLAVGQTLDQASGLYELPELPSMEEGLFTLTEDSRRQHAPNLTHPVLLDIQDSSLSPNLPLLTTCSEQGRTLFNETLFQQTGMDFAPLRGIPDISVTASQASLQRNEVVRLAATATYSDSSIDSFSHSKYPHASHPGAENEPGLFQQLPPLSGEADREKGQAGEEQILPPHVNTKASSYKNDSFGAIGSQKLGSQHLAWEAGLGSQQLPTSLPPKESQEMVSGPDPFLLDSDVPVPFLLEMLEKEVGISKRSGFFSSSDSSSCRSVLGKDPEEKERSGIAENVGRSEKEPEPFVVPPDEERRTFPELDSRRLLSDSVELKNFSGSEHLSTHMTHGLVPSWKPCPVLGDACVITRLPPRRSLNEQPMQHPVVEEKKKELVSAMSDFSFNVSAPLCSAIVGAEYGDPCKELMSSTAGTQPGASKTELTLSGFSIEREHKDTHTPPSFNEGSFFGPLAHPAHHSTPAVFPTRSLKQELHGAPLSVKPVFPSPLSRLQEEASKNSYAKACSSSVEELLVPSVDNTVQPPAEEPLPLQSRPETKWEHSGALQPLKGRFQSLPSLNFMEKVGAWNVNESAERMTDALAVGAPSGASPRQKAYSAIADSLNHILLKQQSQVNLREGLTASLHGPNTAFSLPPYEKKSPCALSLTRSQSESSVIVIDREISRTDISWASIQKDSLQPAEAPDRGLGTHGVKSSDADVEDPVTQRYTAVLVSTISSDEETMDGDGRKRGSGPDSFITSERVAELLREAGAKKGGQESSSSSQTSTTEMSSSHQIGMDHFTDASPDSLNQVIISGAGSCAGLRPPSRQTSSGSSAVSGQLQSSLEEGTKTPDEAREMNIEERIPVYLRNLGIDQSPSSILTPFMPRGPVREIELSPTELRTLKASTDPLMQRLQSSEGDSHSVIDALQSSSHSVMDGMESSFNSSTVSVPALEGPKAGADILLPAGPSLKSSKDLLGQWSVACQNLEPSALKPCPPEISSESSAKPESAEQINSVVLSSIHSGNERSTESLQMLVDTSDAEGVNQETLACSYSSPQKDEMNVSADISSAVIIPEGERVDSSIGSFKTLKEIDKLLAETRTLNIDSHLALSSSSSQDVSGSVRQMKGVDVSEDSVEGSRPRLRRIWSWDEALSRHDVHKDNVFSPNFCLTSNLKWEGLPPADSKSNEQSVLEQSRSLYQIADEEQGVAQHVRRSEPEGCNSVTVNASLPVFVSSTGDASLCTPRDLQEPLDSTSDILGDPRQALEKAREADYKGTDSNRESENSSSVDSLGVQVKNLLQQGRPAMHTIPWGKEEEHSGGRMRPVSVEAGVAGIQESDKSSSLDSLAARLKTILEEERPVMHATRILQSTEEEEKKVRALLKLKLASRLNEDDHLLLEDIRKEHFLRSRMAGNTKAQQWENGYKGISSHSPVQTPSPEPSILSDVSELHQTHCISSEIDVVQADTALPGGADPGTDTALPGDSETTAMNAIHTPAYSQLHANSDKPFNRTRCDCASLCSDTNIHLMGLTEAINVEGASVSPMAHLAADGSSTENAKQITSITFASRKRSPSSSPVSYGGLPGGQPPLEAHSVHAEQVKSSKQQLELPKLSATRSPTHEVEKAKSASPTRALEMDDGPSSSRDHHERMAMGIGEGGGGYEKEFRPEETMSGWRLSTNPPEQMIGIACPRDQLTNDPEGFVRMPEAFTDKNKDSALTKDSKFTFDSFPCEASDAYTGNSGLPPSSFPDHTAVMMPVSPSSPTRKALSGVHITLSPKRIDLGLQSQMNTGVEMRRADALKTGPYQRTTASGLSLETTSKLKPTDLSPKYHDSAYFRRTASSPDCCFRHPNIPFVAKPTPHLSRELGEGSHNCPVHAQGCVRVLELEEQWPEENGQIAASSQTKRLSSDAVTQITTESPEKTTYSSEIFVGRDDDGVGTPPQQKNHAGPSFSAPALTRFSIANREDGEPLLLPYKPPGSSEMYYVPCSKEALKISRVRSETTVESTHSGSNDAIPPDFPAHVLGSRSENPPDDAVAIKHQEGIYSKRSAPKIAWTDEKMASPEGGRVNGKNRDPMESAKTTHSDFRSAQFYLHQPVPLRHEIDFPAGDETLQPYPESGHSTAASGDLCQYKAVPGRSKTSLSSHWRRSEEKFSPLNAELDYSLVEDSRFRDTSERDSRRKELEDSRFREALERDSRRKELEDSKFRESLERDSGRKELEAGDSRFREGLERDSRRKELEDSRLRESLERDSRRKELEDSRFREGLERDSRRKELEAGDSRFREGLERDSRRKELEDSRFREGLERDSRRKELEDSRLRESLERDSRRKELEDSRFRESLERDSRRNELEAGDSRFREGLERDSRRKELEDSRLRESLERDSRRKELEDSRFREGLERDSGRKEDSRSRESLERDSGRKELEDSRFRESLERDSRRKEDSRSRVSLERDSRRKEDSRSRESLERDSGRKELEDSRFRESLERDSRRKEDSRSRESLERGSRTKEDSRCRESLERDSGRKELEDSRFRESLERDSRRKEDSRSRESLERGSRTKEDSRCRESLERDSGRKELEDSRFRESLERDSRRKEDSRSRESLERDSRRKELEDSRFKESLERDSERKEQEDSKFRQTLERDSGRKELEAGDSRFKEGLERDSRRKELEAGDARYSEALERDSRRKELSQHEARKIGQKVAKDLPLPSSQTSSPRLKQVATLPGRSSIPLTASLDELWSKYLERQKQQQQQHPGGSGRHELSLVERLDRLARLLQNPVRQSLMSAKERRSNIQEERRRKEPKKSRSPGKATHKGTLASHRSRREAEESPDTTSNEPFLKPKQRKSGASPTAGHSRRNLKEPSDTSSELRTAQDSSAVTDISTSESDVATQIAETETATQTEESVSVSTIDTARLIRAFGHNRVQVSPKLSQLYSSITLQKTRSDTRAKGSRKAVAADYPKGVQVTESVFSSDSISTTPSSRGPSPALNKKRTTRMLNKAVQAGDLEIVNSATRKNTRDVGFTFPTPTSSQIRFQGSPTNGREPDGFVSRSHGTQKRLPGSFLAERPRKSKPPWLQGMSWFVPANDLKSDSKEGNEYHFIPDSSPSWFEPVTNARPWREPLREKNSQEDQGGLQVRLMVPARDIENKPPPPFVKMTLQDALALHRPDFISRSGERVKRLKLIMEERKLQSVLQSAREELFNPPEERTGYKSGGYLHPNRDYRVIQRKKTISKNEMVQRSKRIYDGLPEVRKRKEEEKRKSDYSTYRLKAQLYKTKITNRVLGRKVPWE